MSATNSLRAYELSVLKILSNACFFRRGFEQRQYNDTIVQSVGLIWTPPGEMRHFSSGVRALGAAVLAGTPFR